MDKDADSSDFTNADIEAFRAELKSKIPTAQFDAQFVDKFVEFYASIHQNLTKNDEGFVSYFSNILIC